MAHFRLPILSFLLLLLLNITIASTVAPPQPNPHQLDNIIDALIGAADFDSWASMLSAADLLTFPLSVTLFVPSDYSLSNLPTSSTTTAAAAAAMDPFTISYHIVPQRLAFSDLCLLKPRSRIPTLLPYKSILITNTSLTNFTLDDSLLSQPDLYISASIAVHGLDTLLNYTVYGTDTALLPPPTPPPTPPKNNRPSHTRPSPPTDAIDLPSGLLLPLGNEIGGSRRSVNADWLYREYLPIVLLIVCVVLGIKIYGNPFGD
ncbi:hypothetical protein SLE2022_338410 [Rubroshorea leprosula]